MIITFEIEVDGERSDALDRRDEIVDHLRRIGVKLVLTDDGTRVVMHDRDHTLRRHMRTHHPYIRLPQDHTALVSEHRRLHHRFQTSHIHGGPNVGPSERPPGWTTGADVIMRPAVGRQDSARGGGGPRQR